MDIMNDLCSLKVSTKNCKYDLWLRAAKTLDTTPKNHCKQQASKKQEIENKVSSSTASLSDTDIASNVAEVTEHRNSCSFDGSKCASPSAAYTNTSELYRFLFDGVESDTDDDDS